MPASSSLKKRESVNGPDDEIIGILQGTRVTMTHSKNLQIILETESLLETCVDDSRFRTS